RIKPSGASSARIGECPYILSVMLSYTCLVNSGAAARTPTAISPPLLLDSPDSTSRSQPAPPRPSCGPTECHMCPGPRPAGRPAAPAGGGAATQPSRRPGSLGLLE